MLETIEFFIFENVLFMLVDEREGIELFQNFSLLLIESAASLTSVSEVVSISFSIIVFSSTFLFCSLISDSFVTTSSFFSIASASFIITSSFWSIASASFIITSSFWSIASASL